MRNEHIIAKTGGLRRLKPSSNKEAELPQEEQDRKDVNRYLTRCKGVVHEGAAGTADSNIKSAGAKLQMAEGEAMADLKLRIDLETRKAAQSLATMKSEQRRGSVSHARRLTTGLVKEEEQV